MVTLQGSLIKIGYQAGAVVLLDDRLNGGGQFVFPGLLQAVLDVGGDNQCAQAGSYFLVRVVPRYLVFDKEIGTLDLSDIMIVGAHAHQQRVSLYRLSSRLSQVSHQDTVMVGARRFHQQPLEQGLIRVGQLQQPGGTGDPEQSLQVWQESQQHNRGKKTVDDA